MFLKVLLIQCLKSNCQKVNPIRPGGGSEARMTKLTAANQKPLTL